MQSKEAQLFDTVVEVDDSALAQIPEGVRKPLIHEYEWTDYVLSKLDQEKDFITHGKNKQRFPKTDALYRILPLVLNVEIIESSSHFIHRADDGTVTVEHTLVLENDEYTKKYIGLCDVNPSNMDPPFSKYLAAGGSTRAKGRALRDALMLRVCVAEELSNVAEEQAELELADKLATSVQKSSIKAMCNRMNIDVKRFISAGANKYDTIDQVKYGVAGDMIVTLNDWQSKPEKIPVKLLKD